MKQLGITALTAVLRLGVHVNGSGVGDRAGQLMHAFHLAFLVLCLLIRPEASSVGGSTNEPRHLTIAWFVC
jgi:hypothetical protein